MRGFFWRHKEEQTPDPLQVALDVTISDLRRVAADLQDTTDAVRERLERTKEKQRE